MLSVRSVEVVYGQLAYELVCDPGFTELWRRLQHQCPHSTAFQDPSFVRVWYEAYRPQWQPLIVHARDLKGGLTGLWLLAYDPVAKVLAHAGAHQAEYQVWLALPGEDVPFLSSAWTELVRRFDFAALQFKYLPDHALAAVFQEVPCMRGRTAVQRHPRPLLHLDLEEVRRSFAKKSNKSRFSRLKKCGRLEFARITDPSELERVFDELIAYYDFRQGAVNRSTPFREDGRKRDFHCSLLAAAPTQTCVTVTSLDQRPIAAFWGMMSGKIAHLGMLIHSPFLAEHSPGKLHLMQLSEHLIAKGTEVLDLTPGGDAWKERFANAHDEVAEAILYRSPLARMAAEKNAALLRWGTRWAGRVGITPNKVKSALAMTSRATPAAVARKTRNWIRSASEFRVYRAERDLGDRCRSDDRIKLNRLTDLLLFEPGESWQTYAGFLSVALTRIEAGERVYTVCVDSRLAHIGWMVLNQTRSFITEVRQAIEFPPGSAALYDFYSHPDFRGRGLYRATIGHMLSEAFSVEGIRYAYISVLADNLPSRHVIESMGFEYRGSFHLLRRFGIERTWVSAESELQGIAGA